MGGESLHTASLARLFVNLVTACRQMQDRHEADASEASRVEVVAAMLGMSQWPLEEERARVVLQRACELTPALSPNLVRLLVKGLYPPILKGFAHEWACVVVPADAASAQSLRGTRQCAREGCVGPLSFQYSLLPINICAIYTVAIFLGSNFMLLQPLSP